MPYTAREHEIWRRLYERMLPRWDRDATDVFLDGVAKLNMARDQVPEICEVNSRLAPLTGFQAVEVEGYVQAVDFFAHLKRRQFPTVITMRGEGHLDYLPEPDIFHDVAGHVPMHTDPVFANTLASFGALAEELQDDEQVAGALARFFWFTIEFGLISTSKGLKAYGSGLMSSYGELEHALHSAEVERREFRLNEVMETGFEIDHFQNRLYVIESFEQLYEAVGELRAQFAPLRFR